MVDNKNKEVREIETEEVEALEKVEVPASTLKNILDRLESVEKSNTDKDSQLELLRNSVSRYKLEEQEFKNKKNGPLTAKLVVYNDKVVTDLVWHGKKHGEYVYNPMNPNTAAGERLLVELTFLDGSKSGAIEYLNFIRSLGRVEIYKTGEKEKINVKGETTKVWTAKFTDSSISEKELEIDPDSYAFNP